MAIVGDTVTVVVPHEPGESFTFRQLTGTELEEADESGTVRGLKAVKYMPEVLIKQMLDRQRQQELEDRAAGVTPDPNVQREREFKGYDWDALIKYGVFDWTYQRACGRADCGHHSSSSGVGGNATCCDELKTRLDPITREWAARQIFEANVRSEGEGRGSGRPSNGRAEIASPSPASWPEPIGSSQEAS
jgi:hypothetical protein